MTAKAKIGFWAIFLLSAFSTSVAGGPQPSLHFIENKNQWPSGIDFGARIPGGNLFIQSWRWRFSFIDESKLQGWHENARNGFKGLSFDLEDCIDGQAIDLVFVDANRNAQSFPFEINPTTFNYFLGNNPALWGAKARAFRGTVYKSIYPGIDLKIYSSGNNIKYDFILAPGANHELISEEYQGVDVFMNAGNIDVPGSIVSMRGQHPVAYQMVDGKRKRVACNYVLREGRIGYTFPEGYDPCYELIIDPLLIFSTYSGSTADNWGSTATPGENGCLYSSGVTSKENAGGFFPATTGAFQTSYGGVYDVAILKYDSTGHNLIYASYLGGGDVESPHSLVMNSQQELLVLGTTGSANFPTTAGAYDRTYHGGPYTQNVIQYFNGSDIFVAKISKDGSQLLASTLIGGSGNDGLNENDALVRNYGDQLRGDIIADSFGNIFLSTVTSSTNFPVSNSFSTSYRGGVTDAVVMKLNASLSQIMWSAFLGGTGADASHTLKLDHLGNIFIAGGTESTDFPATTGSYQPVHAGSVDGWIANITGDGSSIIASTFTGTASFNQIYFLDLNDHEEVYVYGQTVGSFPITSGVYNNPNSGQFIQKFDSHLTTLLFSTVFGSGRGIPDISPTAFLVNNCNNLYMTGWGGIINNTLGYWNSDTFGLPVTNDAFQKNTSGSDFFLMVLTDDAKQLLYSTYMGGPDSRTHVDGGTSRFDKKGVVYHAVCSGCDYLNALGHSSSDFPTTPGAFSRVNGSSNCNNAAFKFDLSSLHALVQTNTIRLDQPGYNTVCIPDKIAFQNLSIGGQIFDWDLGDGTTLVKPDTSLIIHQYMQPGTYTIKLKVIDASTCVGKDSTFTTVHAWLRTGKVGEDQVICYDAVTRLVASGGVQYSWTSEDGKFTSIDAQPTVSPTDTTSYFATVTDLHGCVVTDTVKVSVVPDIDLKFNTAKIYDCFSRPSVRVWNKTDPKEEIFFDFGDGTTSELNEDTHQFQQDGTYPVRIVGKKDFCVYDKQVDVPVYELKVPNVITPHSTPGINDTFVIEYRGRPISASTLRASIVIYNRWGGKVLTSDNYQDDWSGENVQAGVYYYEVDIVGETKCKGWVQVVK